MNEHEKKYSQCAIYCFECMKKVGELMGHMVLHQAHVVLCGKCLDKLLKKGFCKCENSR